MNFVNIVQIVFAIFTVLLLTFVAYVIYNREIMNSFSQNNIKKKVSIFEGIMDFNGDIKNIEVDTYNKNAASFKDLSPSINQQGGAEYSYNFWMYIDHDKIKSQNNNNDFILLLRGHKAKLPYSNDANCVLKSNGEYFLVKNPLLRLTNDGSALIVEYNTLTFPDSFREYGKNVINCNSNSMYDKNKGLLGVYQLNQPMYDKKWFMISVVLRETNPENDILYKNKTSCKIYLNGVVILDRNVESPYNGSYGSTTMKHNRGKLYVNVENSVENEEIIKIANLTYFNYSLDSKEIMSLYNEKFPIEPIKISRDNNNNTLDIPYSRTNEDNMPKPF